MTYTCCELVHRLARMHGLRFMSDPNLKRSLMKKALEVKLFFHELDNESVNFISMQNVDQLVVVIRLVCYKDLS